MQVILNKKGDVYDGKKSDVWSCGVMLYVTLVGQYPFERPEDKGDPQKMHKMIRRIVSVDYKLPSRVEVSDDCKVSFTVQFGDHDRFHSQPGASSCPVHCACCVRCLHACRRSDPHSPSHPL